MAKKVTADGLSNAIKGALDDYSVGVLDSLQEVTQKVSKMGAQALGDLSNSTFKDVHLPKGRYGSGWTTQYETGRWSAQGIIYNKKYPGLPHLLENGHAKRGGGRTAGTPHISTIENKIEDEFTREVIRKITS